MPRRIYIIDPDKDVTDEVIAAAAAVGCSEIMQGVAPNLMIDRSTRGVVELPDPPDAGPPAVSVEQKLANVAAALDAIADPVLLTDVVQTIREAIA
jgi:hypothetical protein